LAVLDSLRCTAAAISIISCRPWFR